MVTVCEGFKKTKDTDEGFVRSTFVADIHT